MRHAPCALDFLDCLCVKCAGVLIPHFVAPAEPCLCPPDMDDLQGQAEKENKIISKLFLSGTQITLHFFHKSWPSVWPVDIIRCMNISWGPEYLTGESMMMMKSSDGKSDNACQKIV